MLKFSNEKLMEMAENADIHRVDSYGASLVGDLAARFLAERAEREKNPGVWDGAPDDADTAYVAFGNSERGSPLFVDKRHTRILPKTKAREIAERYSCDTETCHPMIEGKRAVDVIESAILEALQSEGKK